MFVKAEGKVDLVGGGSFESTINKIFKDRSVKLFSVGPFNKLNQEDLLSGKWPDFFK